MFRSLSNNSIMNFTVTEEMKRASVLSALHAGRTPKEIAEFHKFSLSFVYKIKSKVDNAEGCSYISPKRKKHDPRSDTIRTSEFVARVQEMVDSDPGKSMNKLSKELGVGYGTIFRIINEDLRYRSYILKRGQFMNAAMRERRLVKAKKLLNKVKHPDKDDLLRFFSDEKNFDQDQKANRRNDRWLCKDPDDVPRVMHTKFPATIMILGVISSEGDVMPPYFFERGTKLTAAQYIQVLRDVVKPWMDTVADGRLYVFQQDSAPIHTAKTTLEWLNENVPYYWSPDVWPPSSPDLNPMDYYMWGVVERETNKHPHNNLDSLRQSITDVMTNMDRNQVTKACRRFRSRIEAVVDANGGFID